MSGLPEVVILCGGRATRLGSALPDLPKSMAPISGRPLLAWLVDWALDAGAPRVILCAGYRSAVIRDYFGTPGWRGRVVTVEEPAARGTGGALRLALPWIQGASVLVRNGDSYLPGLDLPAFVAFHRERSAVGSMVLVPARGGADCGAVCLTPQARIASFAEKALGGDYNNAGVYCFESALIHTIPETASLERDLLPAWLHRGFWGYVHSGELVDIGTPARLLSAQAAGIADGDAG